MTKAEILNVVEDVIHTLDKGKDGHARSKLVWLCNSLRIATAYDRGEHFPADHPPPTVLTSEGPKPVKTCPACKGRIGPMGECLVCGAKGSELTRLDLTAEGRPEPDPAASGQRTLEQRVHSLELSRAQVAMSRVFDCRRLAEHSDSIRDLSERLDGYGKRIKACEDTFSWQLQEIGKRLDSLESRPTEGFVLRETRDDCRDAVRALEKRLDALQTLCDDNASATNANFKRLARSR